MWVPYPSKEKYNMPKGDLAHGAFSFVYSLNSEPIRKGNTLQVWRVYFLLEVIQRHQEGPRLAVNISRSLQLHLNHLTPPFTMLEGLVQEYLTAMSCKNQFSATLESTSFSEGFIRVYCYVCM